MPSHTNRASSVAGRISLCAMLAVVSLLFSYVEVILPFQSPVPGIKLGLANLVVLVALFRLDAKEAFVISLLRVLLAGILFAGAYSMLYSLAGSVLSFAGMLLLKKSGLFSMIGVSMAGGVLHNLGQILVAAVMISGTAIFYYLPVLTLSGMLCGIIVGIGAHILIRRIPEKLFPVN